MSDALSVITAARRFLLINPPVDDFTAYSLWSVPLGLLRVAAGLRAAGKEVTVIDLLDDPAMVLPPPSAAPDHHADGRHGFWKTHIPKPSELAMVPRRYNRFGATDDHIRAVVAGMSTPDAILIATGMTYWYRSVIHTADILRERFPGVPIVGGGVAVRLIPERFSAAGLIVERGELYPGVDLSNVSDIAERYGVYPLELLSGCPFRCRYCASAFFHETVRRNDIATQVEALKKWGVGTSKKDAVFFDDALLLDKGRYLKELLAHLEPGRFRFHVPNGLHLRELDAELAALLRLYQFAPLRFGFETISDRFDSKKERAMLAEKVTLLRDAGYHSADIGIYLLCGMPGRAGCASCVTCRSAGRTSEHCVPFPALPAWMWMRESRRIRMGNKSVRMLIGAVLFAVLGTFGTAARAIPISVAFDPPFTFAGILGIDVDPTCLLTDGVHSCVINYLSVDFTDVANNHWVTGTPLLGQTDLVEVVGGAFFGLQATLTSPFLALTGDTSGCDGTQQLMFELPNEDSQRIVTFSCVGVVGDNIGTYKVVPEPGTLALLGLGLACIARSRRRNAS